MPAPIEHQYENQRQEEPETGGGRSSGSNGFSGTALGAWTVCKVFRLKIRERDAWCGHWRKEPIAASSDCLDATAVGSTFIENTTQRGNLDCEVMLLDYGSWPHSAHYLVLQNEISMPLDQDAQHLERTRSDCYRLPGSSRVLPQQAATPPKKAESVELERLRQIERIDGGDSLVEVRTA